MRTQAIRPGRVLDLVSSIIDYDLHAKRVASLADATVGALRSAQLAVGALGRGLAVASLLALRADVGAHIDDDVPRGGSSGVPHRVRGPARRTPGMKRMRLADSDVSIPPYVLIVFFLGAAGFFASFIWRFAGRGSSCDVSPVASLSVILLALLPWRLRHRWPRLRRTVMLLALLAIMFAVESVWCRV